MAVKKFSLNNRNNTVGNPIRTGPPRGSKGRTGKIQIGDGISVTQEQHDDLLQYVQDRLEFSRTTRNEFTDRLGWIDKQLLGNIVLDQDDRKRELQNELGKAITPVDFNLQLTASQIDEAVTYLMNVLAPDEGIYGAVTIPQKQTAAKGLVSLMNEHAEYYQHYRHIAKGCRDAMAYNFGGWEVQWQVTQGNKIATNQLGGPDIQRDEVIMSGNAIPAIDPYNFIWDISCRPIELPDKGEFYACVDLVTPFRLKKGKQDKVYYNVDAGINAGSGGATQKRYYVPRPIITYDGIRSSAGRTNWAAIFSGVEVAGVSDRHEIVSMKIWLIPNDFGLSKIKEMQIWELQMLDSQWIVYARQMDNAHEQLPITIAMPIEDGNELITKSAAEQLIPLQRFASHEMNVHQRDARKKLYGLIVYDEQQIPLMNKADLLGGKIPARPSSQDRDLRKAFARMDDPQTSEQTMTNVAQVVELMQKILPTDMLKQVTDLQRATEYQAAAAVQGGNRKNYKMAKLINTQALMPNKNMQVMNIYQFAEETEIEDANGEVVKVRPSEFRGLGLQWTIGAGLKGMDRLIVASTIKEMLIALVQNAEAAAQIDVVKVMDYLTDLLGDKTDFNGFRIQTPFDKLTPDQKMLALQLLQQAQAEAAGTEATSQGVSNANVGLSAVG